MGNEPKHEVRIPDIEVTVRAASFDCLSVAFYAGKTPHDGFEVVSQIHDMGDRLLVVEVLQTAINELRRNDWITMAELDTRPVENENDLPF